MTDAIKPDSQTGSSRDDLWTVAAIAVLAAIVTNVAHETIGHGVGLLLAGGRSGILTTTRLIVPTPVPDPAWRIFDLGGPAGNLAFAGLGWLGLRLLLAARTRWRLFCWLVMAFSLFWAFGYLLFSGVTGRGDWLALLPEHWWPGRVLLAITGFLLYEASIRVGAHEFSGIFDGSRADEGMRAKRLIEIAWLAGGVIATAGPALDPRGALEMLNSGALSSFAAAVGLLRIPRRLKPVTTAPTIQDSTINRSISWMVVAVAASVFYIAVLGPGIRWRL
ncbi:MAG: hypothetical protein ABR990_14835 [Terracidiphilus sp.]|jgi:hypothetical protein